MEKISELIKEAKPLYRQRKRNVQRAKAAFLGCFLFLALCTPVFFEKFNSNENAPLLSYTYETNSVIEDMGLPVDEYGLLMVN